MLFLERFFAWVAISAGFVAICSFGTALYMVTFGVKDVTGYMLIPYILVGSIIGVYGSWKLTA